jgi:hypothetical protein
MIMLFLKIQLLLQHPHMVVAGLHDGSVAVYNLQSKSTKPSHMSDAQNGKSHLYIVYRRLDGVFSADNVLLRKKD